MAEWVFTTTLLIAYAGWLWWKWPKGERLHDVEVQCLCGFRNRAWVKAGLVDGFRRQVCPHCGTALSFCNWTLVEEHTW